MDERRAARRPAAGGERPLSLGTKATYGLGDFTVNTALVALNLFFVGYYLIEIAELRPALAGLVPVLPRVVDAITDPFMGRISDRTRWKSGRRRPWFLIGAVPYGLLFALLWVDMPFASQAGKFAYYVVIYALLSVAMTVVSVPYLALLPEMALGYDERTSLNTFRNAGSVCGIAAAILVRKVAELLGDGAQGFALAGMLYGVLLTLPWLAVWRVTWERQDFQTRPSATGFLEAGRELLRHAAFRRLTGLYLCGRIAMDLIGAMLVLYFIHVIGRSEDFELAMLCFFGSVIASLPFWLRVSTHTDKKRLFMLGSAWWAASQVVLLLAQPEWPRWTLFAFSLVAGIGFAAVDLMPWSMIGDVVDEDDLAHGERREGLYNGTFMFLRKLGGTAAIAVAFGLLDLSGFTRDGRQSEATLWTLRVLTAGGPALFLLISIWIARSYPITRATHARIRSQLDARGASGDIARQPV